MDISEAGNRLGYHVRVTLKGKGQDQCGFLYTVDPMSGNVVLLDCDNTPPNARVIMQHAIASVHGKKRVCIYIFVLIPTFFICA